MPPLAACSAGARPKTRLVATDSANVKTSTTSIEGELGEPRHDARTRGANALHEVIGEAETDHPGCEAEDEALGDELSDEPRT